MGLQDVWVVLDKMTDTLQVDRGACGGVIVDEIDTLVILYYESSHKAKLFKTFHEILQVDGMHNTNKLGIPLTCHDKDGFDHGWNTCMLPLPRKVQQTHTAQY